MTYIELINRFWKIDMQVQFTGTESKLYFALLDIANSLHWKQKKLSIPNSRLIDKVQCSKPTFLEARKTLVKFKLITYTPGQNKRIAPVYHIIESEDFIIDNQSNNFTGKNSLPVENFTGKKCCDKSTGKPTLIKDKDKDKNNNEYKNPEIEQKHEKVYDFFRTHFKNHERIIKFLKQEEGLGEEFELFMEYCLEGNEWGKYISKAKAPVKYILSIADKQWPYYQVWKGQQYKEATDFAGIGAFNISHVGYG